MDEEHVCFSLGWCSVSVWACLTSSAFQVATLLAVSPRTSGSSWQCLSQQRATRWGGGAEMPGENTDSWRACWREMVSGEAEDRREEAAFSARQVGMCTRRVSFNIRPHLCCHPAPLSHSAFSGTWEQERSWNKTAYKWEVSLQSWA